MNRTGESHRLRLGLLLSGGGARCRRILAGVTDVRSALGGHPRLKVLLRSATEMADDEVVRVLDRAGRAGWRWIAPGDGEFPDVLARTADPPLGLFVRGDLGARKRVAIVGSRAATAYGREVAELIASDLASRGISVVSGMARGIDGCAHRAALANRGHTVAVWGTGPDRVYPAEHRSLADEIASSGALITEFAPGTPPRPYHFPPRNRIIAGLCEAVIVVEAAVKSGALVTARLALDEGREVLAVPGSILSEQSVGPNALIRMGARPLLTAGDVAELIGESAAAPTESDDDGGLIGRGEALTVDELAARAGVEVPEVLETLLQLEIEGAVEQGPDGRYRRRGTGWT